MIDPNHEFPDVMTDIETTSTDAGSGAIIQIAAVRFNLEKRTVCHDFFDRCLMIPPHRYWGEQTREWWLKRRDVLQSILGRGEDPAMVIRDFYDWSGSGRRFWGKPTHFDYSFLQSYFLQFELPMPYHYRYAENMNTWIRARYFPDAPPEFEREMAFEGDKHNALHDVLHQIKVLFAAADATRQIVFVP